MSETTSPSDGGLAAPGAPQQPPSPDPAEAFAGPPPTEAHAEQPPADVAAEASVQGAQVQAPVAVEDLPTGKAVIARYGVLRSLGLFRHDLDESPRPGTKVVVRSERGLELAEVVAGLDEAVCAGCIRREQLAEHLRCAGSEYPFYRSGRLLRLANDQDLIDQRHLAGSAHEEAQYCRKEIRELKLSMKLVTVEHLLGGERIIFYFSSESRIDFRELVRRLAAQFRTRIEMRQVGARDEARLVGDFERCGRPCCCQSFLKDLRPVSMRMAKMQKATLDPSKISGRCGRLMCCLRYEDAGYEELRAKLPRRNSFVRIATGAVGKVVDMQVLTQLVRLLLADGAQTVVGNEDIIERNVPPPPPGAMQGPLETSRPPAWMSRAMRPRPAEVRPAEEEFPQAPEAAELEEAEFAPQTDSELEPVDQAAEPAQSAQEQRAEASPPPAAGPPSARRHRRRRHRRHPPREGQQAQPAQAQAPAAQAPTAAPGQGPPGQAPGGGGRRRRRHRRRRH